MVSPDTAAYVKTETHQLVTTIEFYHPQGNSLPAKILHDLAHAIHDAGIDFNTRVIIIRSGGIKAFCGGASFDELAAINNEAKGLEFFSGFSHVVNAMRKCPKLIIGRIHGKCVGGGVGIAAAVDYAIAQEGADIKLSELSIGFGPFVIAPAVERKIGAAAFAALSIDSAHWRNSEWALRKGLFAELHNTSEALDEAITKLADSLAHSNPEAMLELKQVLWKGTENWDQLLKDRAAISGRLALSDFTVAAIAKLKNNS
jgi:methylglutaconyl-CoA hydratase